MFVPPRTAVRLIAVLSIGSVVASVAVSSVRTKRTHSDEPAVTGSIHRSRTDDSFARFRHDHDRRAELVSQGFKPVKKALH